MKNIIVTKKELVLGAALVIFCFVLGMVSVMPAEANNVYTDEEILNGYIEYMNEESVFTYDGILIDEHTTDEYIAFELTTEDGCYINICRYPKDLMIQCMERGY